MHSAQLGEALSVACLQFLVSRHKHQVLNNKTASEMQAVWPSYLRSNCVWFDTLTTFFLCEQKSSFGSQTEQKTLTIFNLLIKSFLIFKFQRK